MEFYFLTAVSNCLANLTAKGEAASCGGNLKNLKFKLGRIITHYKSLLDKHIAATLIEKGLV